MRRKQIKHGKLQYVRPSAEWMGQICVISRDLKLTVENIAYEKGF